MLGPHRTPSNNETSMEIQSWFLSLDFFFLRREGFELQKASTFQHVDSFSHDTPKTHFDFYCCSFTQPRAYKEPWFCYVCAAGSKVLQLLEGETGSRKELIQIMLLCEIRHTSYHIRSGVWRLKLHKWANSHFGLSYKSKPSPSPHSWIWFYSPLPTLSKSNSRYRTVYMCFFKKNTHCWKLSKKIKLFDKSMFSYTGFFYK